MAITTRRARSRPRLTRKIITTATMLVTTLAVAACSSNAGATSPSASSGTNTATNTGTKLGPNDTFKLGVSLTLNNTDFWTSYITYEQQFAQQYNAKLLGPIVNNGDAGKQITDIHTLIDEGAQALIVNPVDSAAIKPALDYAASKGVPVISVDVAPTAGKTFMIVRADNKLYGQESCQYIGAHVKSGSVADLEGNLASLNGRDRSDAFSSCMKKNFPSLKVVNYPTKWDSATAVNAASTALGSVSDLKAIYVQWSGPIPGILQTLKSDNRLVPEGQPGHVVVVSNDGVPFELQNIRAGTQDATVSQPADLYAKYSVYYARQALEGKTYTAGEASGHGTNFINLYGNLEDPIKAPLVTKANVNDKSLWGNHTQP